MTDFLANASFTTLVACVAGLICYFFDFQFMGALFTINAMIFATITIGALLLAGALWIKRHVRVTII